RLAANQIIRECGVAVQAGCGRDDGQGLLSGNAGKLCACGVGALRESKILLCDLEFVEEPIFENIYFVDVDLPPERCAVVADVANVQHRRWRDLSLQADVPGLHVSHPQVRIELIYSTSSDNGNRICRPIRLRSRRQRYIAEPDRSGRSEI